MHLPRHPGKEFTYGKVHYKSEYDRASEGAPTAACLPPPQFAGSFRRLAQDHCPRRLQ